ncbi:MAG TPA: tetratricopeptide repeat protein [Planctomycetaceae bacterium]|nr:tetratricopeptide repeat protein [Planctomycetaceae bacterium]
MSSAMPGDQKRKIAADCWMKGNQALAKGNFDYAIEMYRKAVQLGPDNLSFRQSLRGAEYKKYDDNKSGAKLAGVRLTGTRNTIRKLRGKKEWPAMDQAAEEGLMLNPWDAQLNADVGEACYNLGYSEVAEFSYERAVESDSENKGFLQNLMEINEERGNYKKAIECAKRLTKLEPNNGKLRAQLTGLEAKQVMDRGGYEGAKSTQQVRRNAYDDYRPATDKHVPDTVAGPGVSLEQDLRRAIRKAPTEKGNYVKLAEYFGKQKEFDKAGDVLKEALDATGGDVNIREFFEDNDLANYRHQIELAKSITADDEAGQKRIATLKRELLLREIEVFASRIERYPTDARFKYELGKRHMQTKEYKKAIPLLQQATVDQRRAASCQVLLAKCFLAERQPKLARAQLERAVEKLNPHDEPETYCEAHYILARLCEDAGDRDDAEHHYGEVLSVDYSYKDARERLEKLQGGDGKAAGA